MTNEKSYKQLAKKIKDIVDKEPEYAIAGISILCEAITNLENDINNKEKSFNYLLMQFKKD